MVQSTNKGLLSRNVIWNLFGQTIPLLFAVIAIPILIRSLGKDKFGIITLGWVVMGYFSFFDLGLGRALTKLTAEQHAKGNDEEIRKTFWVAQLLMLSIGLVGLFVSIIFSEYFIKHFLKIPENLLSETINSFVVLSFSVPVVIVTTGLRGFLEALQRFDLLTWARIPLGLSTYLTPLLILTFSQSTTIIFIGLLFVRILNMIIHLILCIRVKPFLKNFNHLFDKKLLKSLMSFGGWMTISNAISPLMVYIDRFVIGAMLSLVYVTYYTTPYEMVTKMLIIPSAFTAVLFPAFSSSFVTDEKLTAVLFEKGYRYLFLLLFPIGATVILLAPIGLNTWLGNDFKVNSTLALQILAMGVIINALAFLPFSLIQGLGRPDITAKIHLIEFPIYILMVWFLTKYWKINGTALAWTVRVFLDSLLLFYSSTLLLRESNRTLKHFIISMPLVVIVFIIAKLISNPVIQIAAFIAFLLLFIFITWFYLIKNEEKTKLFDLIRTCLLFRKKST